MKCFGGGRCVAPVVVAVDVDEIFVENIRAETEVNARTLGTVKMLLLLYTFFYKNYFISDIHW